MMKQLLQSCGGVSRTALLIISLAVPGMAAGQALKDTYPRIGAYEIGGSKKIGNAEYREALAKYDIAILGMWRGWNGVDSATGESMNIRDVVVDIKRRAARNNHTILLGKYTIINENHSTANDGATRDRWDKLHSETGPGYPRNNDWWARDRNGENTTSFQGTWNTNLTEYVKRDANGDTWAEWAVTRDYKEFFKNIPEFDIWFFDNWFYQPRVSADWDGNGTDDSRSSSWVRTAYRKGYMNAARRVRQLAPNIIIMGNVDGDPTTGRGMLTESEYKGQITALYESAIGRSWSRENWGWEGMMQQYRTTLRNAKNNLLIMTVHGEAEDYATMRYGLASCLMDNGYYYYTPFAGGYGSALWFDEFDVNLGRPIDPPQSSAWQKGVYMRRFENGIVLVNPKGNGTRTVQLDPGYRRIQGTQDRQTNNGQPASSVTLNERDGIILLRDNQQPITENAPPKAPVLSM
jgi:hypothetical protein